MCWFHEDLYDEAWKRLNSELQRENGGNLVQVVHHLERQQRGVGFIQFDLKGNVIRWRIPNPDDQSTAFTVQFNHKRAERKRGAGVQSPPPAVDPIHNGCFLCKANVRWQQRGTEIGYDMTTEKTKRDYVVWMNPFPLMPTHINVATAAHEPQSWIVDRNELATEERIAIILNDLVELSAKLPGFVGFYNAEGAGATIPEHLHLQFFKRRYPDERFTLEAVAAPELLKEPIAVLNSPRYPVSAIAFRGDREWLVQNAAACLWKWTNFYHPPELTNGHVKASANVIVTARKGGDPKLYLVPRHKEFSHAPGMLGEVAGLEVLGELVFSSKDEKVLVDHGRVNYEYVEKAIRAVEPPGATDFLKNVVSS